MNGKRSRVAAALAVVWVCIPLGGMAAAPADDRPNVVWIVGEDMGPELGCYGDPNAKTPNIDPGAREGPGSDLILEVSDARNRTIYHQLFQIWQGPTNDFGRRIATRWPRPRAASHSRSASTFAVPYGPTPVSVSSSTSGW